MTFVEVLPVPLQRVGNGFEEIPGRDPVLPLVRRGIDNSI